MTSPISRTTSTQASAPCVLLADDDPVTRTLVDHHLKTAGYRTKLAEDGDDAIRQLDAEVSLAIFDVQMPKKDGLECLRQSRERFPDLPVLIISQAAEIRDAVEAMKHGAFEFIAKPIVPDELLARIRQAQHVVEREVENRQLREAVSSPLIAAEWVGTSEADRRLMERLHRTAELDSTVLITGESGTGKTTVARMIHHLGPRKTKPFVSVSCAALPRDLIEAELFGHVKGAFTGATSDRPGRAEMADGGTLFLDEIGDLPLELQPKLLTFLQDHEVQRLGDNKSRKIDVRVITATHQDLEARARTGQFRQDLYFRLAVLTLSLNPLRERTDDIEPLCRHILSRISRKRNASPYQLTEQARACLAAHAWPGNVRELENVLERASAFCKDATIDVADLGLELPPPLVSRSDSPQGSLAGMTLADVEKRAIIETLAFHQGNKKAAARSLGIDEKSIYNKMKRLGIDSAS